MAERNPYHVPAGSSEGGQFTYGQLGKIERAAREGAGVNPHWVDYEEQSAQAEDQPKMMHNRTYGIMLEGAGDIMREQWKWYGKMESPAGMGSYIMEKVNRIKKYLEIYPEAKTVLDSYDLGLVAEISTFWQTRVPYDQASRNGIWLVQKLLERDWVGVQINLDALTVLYGEQ